ncbi:N-formylglutamate deformylase [Paraburkholderia ribeironis]|uniref:N-formylglutamate deformylase n=1 Tax=Paraburkholderia ribeironis TaxID=1247936 RepID=A0A1N7S729_9BURK|nr:N-formylglutamate deformylase [Paraburkholderia ribeironis]SIT43237.1 N-formylglutamate deformylase [Paraburkholderia ribeironis]
MQEAMFTFHQGEIPLLVSIPHLGTEIPAEIAQDMTDAAHAVADTDWHLDRLYSFAKSAGASILGARYSRYVIDLNRPPGGESLYPGQTTTGLCPTETFRGEPLYLDDKAPTQEQVQMRLEKYWRPYHEKLRAELDRMKQQFGQVLLWEAHSIASVLPRLFEGKLPDLNIGTNAGASCDASILDAISAELVKGQPFTWVANGRFKGGFITRAFGQPSNGIHAVQLEMCQSSYMDEAAPFGYRQDLAERIQPVVDCMISAAVDATLKLRAGTS